MKRAYSLAILVVLVVFAVSPVLADPIPLNSTIDLTFGGFPAGVPEGGVTVDRTFNDRTSGSYAALLRMFTSGGAHLDTYCVQIGVHLNTDTSSSTTYTAVTPVGYTNDAGSPFNAGPGSYSGGLSSLEIAALGKLWANALPAVSTPVQSAALQLAIWELVYENGTQASDYNVGSGLFQIPADASSADITDARDEANLLLEHAFSPTYWTTSDAFVILHSNDYQDLIAPTSVPEPATMLLLGLGIAGVGLIRRRIQA